MQTKRNSQFFTYKPEYWKKKLQSLIKKGDVIKAADLKQKIQKRMSGENIFHNLILPYVNIYGAGKKI